MSAKGRDLAINSGVPQKPLAVVLGAYKIYRDRAFSFSVFQSARITMRSNSISYEFHW
jgi:hypothetical protein